MLHWFEKGKKEKKERKKGKEGRTDTIKGDAWNPHSGPVSVAQLAEWRLRTTWEEAGVDLEKKQSQPISWELCFIWVGRTFRTSSSGNRITSEPEELSRGGAGVGVVRRWGEGVRLYRSLQQGAFRRMSKNYCSLRKTRYLKVRNLAHFYGEEAARVWTQWSHSFHTHLSYLGPASWDLIFHILT